MMNLLNRIKKLESKMKINDDLILYLDLGDGYIKQVNGINETLSKENFELQTKDMKAIEIV